MPIERSRHVVPMLLGATLAAVLLASRTAAQDPTTADCLAATEKSVQLRQQHRLRAARAELLICAASSCPVDIRNECGRRVAEVNSSMPTIVFEARDELGNDLSAVRLIVDGQKLVDRLEGTALSIDPGEHTFQFDAAEMDTVIKRFVIRVGEKERRERVEFKKTAGRTDASSGSVAQASAPSPAAFSLTSSIPQDDPGQTRRTVGYVVGGVGVAALALAVYEQTVALDRDSRSDEAAVAQDSSTQATAGQLHDQAVQAQTYAIVFGSIGAAAIGVGIYLVLSAESPADPKSSGAVQAHILPILGRDLAGLLVQHAW